MVDVGAPLDEEYLKEITTIYREDNIGMRQDKEALEVIKAVYNIVIEVGTYPVSNIRTAEAVGVDGPPIPRHRVEVALQPVVLEPPPMPRPDLVHRTRQIIV